MFRMNRHGSFLQSFVPIFIAIVIGLSLVIFALNVGKLVDGETEISYGFNGVTETRCISGYKFTVSPDGSSRQMISESGKGIPC